MASDQAQVLKSARRVAQAVNNELAKLGPSGRRALLYGIHQGLAQRIAEDDKATRADQQHKMLALSRGVLKLGQKEQTA